MGTAVEAAGLHDQQVLLLVRSVWQPLIEYTNIVAEVAQPFHDRSHDRLCQRRQEISHRRARDLPHTQTRRDAPYMLQGIIEVEEYIV